MTKTIVRWSAALLVAGSLFATGCSRNCATCAPSTDPSREMTCGNAEKDTWDKIAMAIGNPTKAPRVLLLSGGGSFGAWGSGFLNGWTQQAGGERPRFDLVTGSSTGAILGTWALLGSRADAYARCAYTDTTDSDVYDKALLSSVWLQPWRWRSVPPWVSLKNLDPLRTLFRKYTPIEQVEEVGRIWRDENRVFLVGTVNLELGSFCLWDMGKLAQPMIGADDKTRNAIYEQYMEIVMASSSNPGIFNPTFLPSPLYAPKTTKRDMHVDGGVRHQIFFQESVGKAIRRGIDNWEAQQRQKQVARSTVRRQASGDETTQEVVPTVSTSGCNSPDDGKSPRLYSIVNLPGVVPRLCTGHDIYHIAQRSLTVMTIQSMIGDLHQIRKQWDDMFVSPSRPDFCVSRIPDTTETWPFADDFPECMMRGLYDTAFERATSAAPWETKIMTGGPSPKGCQGKPKKKALCPAPGCDPKAAGCPPGDPLR
jgi:predicted acylesterase/phospholipase RssA